MEKHIISTDERLNSKLKKEVTSLRGGIVSQANKTELSSRFEVANHEALPRVIITDTESNKSVEVSLYAYGEVRKVLNALFE